MPRLKKIRLIESDTLNESEVALFSNDEANSLMPFGFNEHYDDGTAILIVYESLNTLLKKLNPKEVEAAALARLHSGLSDQTRIFLLQEISTEFFGTRTYNSLRAGGFIFMFEVYRNMCARKLATIRNMGRRSIKEIEALFGRYTYPSDLALYLSILLQSVEDKVCADYAVLTNSDPFIGLSKMLALFDDIQSWKLSTFYSAIDQTDAFRSVGFYKRMFPDRSGNDIYVNEYEQCFDKGQRQLIAELIRGIENVIKRSIYFNEVEKNIRC